MNGEPKREKRTLASSFIKTIRTEATCRKNEKGAFATDVGVFLCAFFLAGRHIAFGSYPLGAALVAILPSRVWIALLGALTGSLSMGRVGIIHAAAVFITAFLRALISSGGARGEDERLFSEPLIMRLSAVTIGAFAVAGYEMLTEGFTLPSLLFGIFEVGLSLGFAFVFSGLFIADISVRELLFGENESFPQKKEGAQTRLLLFSGAICVLIFLLSISLIKYDFFGISLAYVFSVSVTLFGSRKFGVIWGIATGFISSLGISALYSPGFAVVGAVSGFLYPFGTPYALLGSAVFLSAWAAYVGGVGGFLSVFAEFLVGSALVYGAIRKIAPLSVGEKENSLVKTAEEMVGASWLSRDRDRTEIQLLLFALKSSSEKIRRLMGEEARPEMREYIEICARVFAEEKIPMEEEKLSKIATKLYKKEKITEKERSELSIPDKAIDKILFLSAEYEKGLYEKRRAGSAAEQYGAVARMISDSLLAEREGQTVNPSLTEAAGEVFFGAGFPDGCIKVFGEKKIKVVAAGNDPDGRKITSPELKANLEAALGYRLGSYEYYRRGEMALFTAEAVPGFAVEYATVSHSATEKESSGDSARFFESEGRFYSVLSDGMGTGEQARRTADFVSAYLADMLSSEVSVASALSSVGHILRQRESESSATLDLFSFNLLDGEAVFTKCGAAPSYVKRGRSIFRVRSESCPLGLMETLDAEKIRVEVKEGDVVIMLSDGVSASSADAAWLLSFLSKEECENSEKYANGILSLAKKSSFSRDDMTVSVIRILSK